MNRYPCDICESSEVVEVPYSRLYSSNEPINICKNCGFVYVQNRRTAQELADYFSNEVFENDNGKKQVDTYTSRIPAIKARQTYVVDYIDSKLSLNNKTICDIGAGEGQFLEMASSGEYGARVFGIEPSKSLCEGLTKDGIENFNGILEDFVNDPDHKDRQFDIVTLMWTLVNSNSCRNLVERAYQMVKPGGYLVVAESSRILVPFKKPLQLYISKNPVDGHAFHFSANALRNLLRVCGFKVVHMNRYIDSDVMCVIAQKTDKKEAEKIVKDDPDAVVDFFNRWHQETHKYYTEVELL